MTTAVEEKKLAYFAEAIEREIDARRLRAKHQNANDISKKKAEQLEAAEDQINARIEANRQEQARRANKRIALATAEAKAEFNSKRTAVYESLRAEIANQLHNFTKSGSYTEYLPERIKEVKAALNLDSDATTVETAPQGGFILQSRSGKADFTFKTRLEEVDFHAQANW